VLQRDCRLIVYPSERECDFCLSSCTVAEDCLLYFFVIFFFAYLILRSR
jgi:hypothetical protein